MIPHDILTLYSAKAVEYLLALLAVALFIPFWRYAMEERRAPEPAAARQGFRPATDLVGWFQMARDFAFHPGHTWARSEGKGFLTVGMDDFAQRLLGPMAALELPRPGTRLSRGQTAWTVKVDGKSVEMVSPVDGYVRRVNAAAAQAPQQVKQDPYGQGWLLMVETPRAGRSLKGLFRAEGARRFFADTADRLSRRMSPELGLAYQDGGVPVDGLARAIDPERWEEVAREFLRP